MRLPDIHKIYDVIDKMNAPFIMPDILLELREPEWSYRDETYIKSQIRKALSNQVKHGTIERTGEVIPSGFGQDYIVYRRTAA